MKYKVGDTVRIKTWKQMEKEYGLYCWGNIKCNFPNFSPKMEKILNKIAPDRIVKISEIYNDADKGYFMENFDILSWVDDMIEGLEIIDPKEKINSRFEILDL